MNLRTTFRAALLLATFVSIGSADDAPVPIPTARLANLNTILASSEPTSIPAGQQHAPSSQPRTGLVGVPTAWGWPGGNGNLLHTRVDPLGQQDSRRREYRRGDLGRVVKEMLQGGDPESADRHFSKGSPLEGTSWLNRPLHADWFAGTLHGSSPARGHASLTTDAMAGIRFGRDFGHFSGWESRVAFSKMGSVNADDELLAGHSRVAFYDLHLMNYPWGDTTWRPYWSLGMGIATFRFNDDLERRFRETLFHFPISIGLKHHTANWMTLRLDLSDNIAFGSAGLNTMHNFSATVGMEIRFGGRRRSYFPWKPDRYIW